MFIGKNLLRILLTGWIIGAPYHGSQAMENPEKSLKRPHDGVTIEVPQLKKQKVDPESEIMEVIELPEAPLQEITPLLYTNDVLRCIASFLDLHSYQAFRCVNTQTYGALNDGWGLVYEHRFDRPGTYVTNLLTQFPMLQLGLILGENVQGKENTEKAADFVCSILQNQFAKRVRTLYLIPPGNGAINNEKAANINGCIISSSFINPKTLSICEELSYSSEKSHLVGIFESQIIQKLRSLNLLQSFYRIDNINSLMALIKKTSALNSLSFNDDLYHRADAHLFFSDYFFEEFPKALSCNHSLISLNFQGCHFELAQVPHVLTMMEHANATLTTLILDDDLFGFEGIGMILTKNKELNITKNKSLKNISFKNITTNSRFEDDSILENFIEVLKNESTLESLNLSVQLVDLKRNFALFPKIILALSTNITLEKLCLYSIPFHESDQKNLTNFFHTNVALKRLELPRCFSNMGPRNYFIDAFKENTTIQELILDDQTKTFFGENKMKKIKEILHRNLLISMGKRKD